MALFHVVRAGGQTPEQTPLNICFCCYRYKEGVEDTNDDNGVNDETVDRARLEEGHSASKKETDFFFIHYVDVSQMLIVKCFYSMVYQQLDLISAWMVKAFPSMKESLDIAIIGTITYVENPMSPGRLLERIHLTMMLLL